MLPRRIASRYADALFSLAQEQGKTTAWAEELRGLADVLAQTPELREVLTHPEIPLTRKTSVVNSVFQGKVSPEVLAVLFLLIMRGHDPAMSVIHEIFVQRWNQARRVIPVSVVSAIPLTPEQATTLSTVLAKRTGATVQLHQSLNPDLIAGMIVTMGDRVIDASASTALANLRQSMAGA